MKLFKVVPIEAWAFSLIMNIGTLLIASLNANFALGLFFGQLVGISNAAILILLAVRTVKRSLKAELKGEIEA